MHRVLERQIAKARRGRADGSVDVDVLLQLIDASYEEADRERRLNNRTLELMEVDMRTLHEAVRVQNETLLKGVLEAVGDGVVLADHRGVITDINPSIERLFGYTRDDMIGQDLSILLTTEGDRPRTAWLLAYDHDRSHENAGATSGAAAGRPAGKPRETLGRRKDGTLFPLELAVGDLARSGIRHFVAIVRDISDRLRVQRELEDSRQRFRDFAEAASDWMWETDSHHRFVAFSGNFQRIRQFDPKKNVGRTRFELMQDTVDPALVAQHRADLEARRPFRDFVYPFIGGDGQIRQLRIAGRPVFAGDGSFVGYRGTASDITDMRQAQERATIVERRMATAIAAMSEGFVLFDSDGRIVTRNDRYCDFYPDFGGTDAAGKTLEAVLREGIAAGIYDTGGLTSEQFIDWRLARHRACDGAPTLIRLVNGRVLRVRERRTPDGGIVGVHSDVTDELNRERAMEEARDAAEAGSRAKSEFLAVMSHEIRTPMNGVLGMTSLLLSSALTHEQRHYANTIRSSAEHLLAIINDILDFSKVEAGHMDIEIADFDVPDLVESVVEILATRAQAKGVEIASFVAPGARLICRGDAGRVRQVLMNLTGNAVKFTDQGWVSVEVAADILDKHDDEPAGADGLVAVLQFVITDTGIGIDEAIQPSLFERFVQADGSSTRRHEGTGLGLAISKQLTELMGGSIGFTSSPGKGACFWVQLPLAVSGSSPSQPVGLDGAHILVVDDVPVNRDFMRQRLATAGAAVATAEGAAQALAQLAANRMTGRSFDAVVIDGAMPDGDGFNLAAAVRADPALAGTRLILAASANVVPSAGELGPFDAALRKPVRDAVLLTTLARQLGRMPELSADARAPMDSRFWGVPMRALRILVVEDNPVNQQVAQGLLRRMGHSVDVAGDGLEALEIVGQHRYDLIFMDVRMPHLDGLAATRRIRAMPGPVAATPIVAMTANAMRGDEEDCLEAGMDGYLPKPIDRERLAQTVFRFAGPAEGSGDGAPVDAHVTPTPPEPAPLAEVAEAAGDLVDELMLQDMVDVLDIEGVDDLIARFFADVPRRVAALREALGAADREAAIMAVHAVKGSAGSLGLVRLSAQARDAEMALRGLPEGAPLPEIADLTPCIAQTRAAVTMWREGLEQT